jgi:molecular chaperone HscC
LSRIELPLRRALGDVNIAASMIDEVILVGGATRMPAVRDRVEAYFQKVPRSRFDPDEVVAMGAAVQAGLIDGDEDLEDVVVTDVAPFTLGVEVSKRMGLDQRPGYFSPIIHRNTTIPVSRSHRYSTIRANQTEMRIGIYQGESRRVSDNHKLGELIVDGIPLAPPGQEVDVRMTYDLNGVLEVEATVVDTGEVVSTVIARHAHGLSEKEIAAAVESMKALKTHPREAAENRFLLRRAERLYRELPFQLRDDLGELVDGFEQVLEMQDPTAICRTRQRLLDFLDRCEHGDTDNRSQV